MTLEEKTEDLEKTIKELKQDLAERDYLIDSLKDNIKEAIYYLNK